jgi:hypothetical protein
MHADENEERKCGRPRIDDPDEDGACGKAGDDNREERHQTPPAQDRCEQRHQRHERGLQPSDEVNDFHEKNGYFLKFPLRP